MLGKRTLDQTVSHRPQPVKQQRKSTSAAQIQSNNAALAFKELHRTVKKARAFEIRKLVRRIKQLRGQSAGKGDDDQSGDDDATNSTIAAAETGKPESEEALKIIADLELVKAMDVDVLTGTAARKLAADAFQVQLSSMTPSPYLPSGSTAATAGEREKMLALRIVHSKQVATVCEAAKKKHEKSANVTAVVAATPSTTPKVESAVKESVEKSEESVKQTSVPAKKMSLLDKLRAALAAPAPDQSDDEGSQSDSERMQWSSDDDSDDFPIAFGNRDSDGDDDERVAEAAAAAAGQFGDDQVEKQSDSEPESAEVNETPVEVEAVEPAELPKADDKRPAKKPKFERRAEEKLNKQQRQAKEKAAVELLLRGKETKNRKGQRARREHAERIYGRDANHLAKQLGGPSGKPSYQTKAQLPNREQRPSRDDRPAQKSGDYKPQQKPAAQSKPAAPKAIKPSAQPEPVDPSLHPSWAARKNQKVVADFSGQKVKFDD